MKILVKSREDLQKVLDKFCEDYKDKFDDKGICSEANIRRQDEHRYDLFAGKELEADKVPYMGSDFQGFTYDYRVKYTEADGKESIFPIFPNEIVKEIKDVNN